MISCSSIYRKSIFETYNYNHAWLMFIVEVYIFVKKPFVGLNCHVVKPFTTLIFLKSQNSGDNLEDDVAVVKHLMKLKIAKNNYYTETFKIARHNLGSMTQRMHSVCLTLNYKILLDEILLVRW